jgi:hypothetical protein
VAKGFCGSDLFSVSDSKLFFTEITWIWS